MRCLWLVVPAIVACADCGPASPPACITVDPQCKPLLYVPSFDNVYANTLMPHCGSKDSGCHSNAGHAAGLIFSDEQTAYDERATTAEKPEGGERAGAAENPGASERAVPDEKPEHEERAAHAEKPGDKERADQ